MNKKYSVIYADPPWNQNAGSKIPSYTVDEYGKQIWPKGNQKSLKVPYDTMSVNEIKSFPIQHLINDNAHLYIWATNKYLPDAFDVIKARGFNYSTTIVWAKNMMGGGLGGAFKINTEYLLFAKKGILPTKESVSGTWHNVKRDYKNGFPNHSSKPKYFHELIEKVSPGPYLELFARSERDNWDVYGNQVKNSIIL